MAVNEEEHRTIGHGTNNNKNNNNFIIINYLLVRLLSFASDV